MHRFFAAAPGIIQGEELEHLRRVLRLKPGDEIEAIWEGENARARLTDVGAAEARYEIVELLPSRETATRVTLYQGVCKGERMDYLTQKAAELGVHAIQPVLLTRCVAGPLSDNKVERLCRIAKEAAKQSGGARCPKVLPPLSFAQALEDMAKHQALLMPYEEGGAPIQGPYPRDIALLIGPEGGITEEEAAAVKARGGLWLTLGKRILRTETAGPVALALLLQANGDLS